MKILPFTYFDRLDYKGRTFSNFHPRKNPNGPGFVIYGFCDDPKEYNGNLIKVCGRLIKQYKNGRIVFTGFRREIDAYRECLYMNGTDLGTIR